MEISSSHKNISSFCFLGTGLELEFNEEIYKKYYIRVEITFITNLLIELNKDIIILNLKNEKNPIKFTINEIKDKIKQDAGIKYIDIHISEEINFQVKYKNNEIQNVYLAIPINETYQNG